MLLHVVLFEPKPDLAAASIAALIASIRHAATAIPSVRRFEVGPRLVDGPPYPSATPLALSYAAIVSFDDRDGLMAYLAHPAHAELGRLFNQSLANALVFDFEVEDARTGEALTSLQGLVAGRPRSEA